MIQELMLIAHEFITSGQDVSEEITYADINGIYSVSVVDIVNVEMEIVLPGNMTVIESHDLALEIQHKIERLQDVERAFVHVSC